MTADGVLLEQLWTAAAAKPPTKAFRTAPVGVDCTKGPLLAAVDREGRRCLLVPIPPRQTLAEDIDGRAVTLRRRALEDEQSYRTYACLQLVAPNLGDLFTTLCAEVVEAVAAAPDRAVATLRKVLNDWRALLAGALEALSPSALAGLFGELCVLMQMLDLDAGAVAFWTGPTGSAQDFHRGIDAVEVKTTTAPEGRRIRVNGLDQLELGTSGRLLLRWFRLRTDRGSSVPELVDEILELTDDQAAFRKLLLDYGYRDAEREIYSRRTFEVVEQRTYDVGPGFPRIVPSGFPGGAAPSGVERVEYVVDLDSAGAQAARCDHQPVEWLSERL
jgi:hypothetical protein